MLTGTTNSSQIEPVFVGSDDCQVIEDGNEVDCLGNVTNHIQAVEYSIVGSNRRQLPSDADSVSVIISDGAHANSSDTEVITDGYQHFSCRHQRLYGRHQCFSS